MPAVEQRTKPAPIVQISTYTRQAVVDQIDALAEQEGITRADYIRRLILADLRARAADKHTSAE